MTNIPFQAIGAALSPVQRDTNEMLRARKVQSTKDSHHTEDVEELDETAVNSVDDRRQGGGRQKDPHQRQDEPEEKVEIATLSATPRKPQTGLNKAGPQLDISA